MPYANRLRACVVCRVTFEDQHQAHPVDPGRLTVHHLWAVAEGGWRVGGPKVVLCKQENARLGGQLNRR